jgi:hypothetical protein
VDLLAFAHPGRLHIALRATVTRIIINPIDPGEKCIHISYFLVIS